MTAVGRLVFAASLVFALAVPASASGARPSTEFQWSTHVPIVVLQGTPHTGFFVIEPFEADIPNVGPATVQIQFVTCLPCDTASLSVHIDARGGTLTLGGGSNSDSEVANGGTWGLSAATGKYKRWTGSGTWTWTEASPGEGGWDVTLSFVGQLGRA
ncbi:MAG: hypothetical protein M3321_07385 [Actinomycetota bacterium]|nr:hypothetical protein [Actinomycetota bacterium]